MELHEYEAKVLPLLTKTTDYDELVELAKKEGLDDIQVKRATQWLANKQVLVADRKETNVFSLGPDGEKYLKDKLPEIRVLDLLKSNKLTQTDLIAKARLLPPEFGALLGRLKKQNAVVVEQQGSTLILSKGQGYADAVTKAQSMQNDLALLSKGKLSQKGIEGLSELRGVVEKKQKAVITLTLTQEGKKLASKPIESAVSRLTRDMLLNGTYKNVKFRAFGLNDNVPPIAGGRKHFVTQSKEYIKSIWLELGFEEMGGDYVQSAFWDLDALFVPQDHPARTMQDTFYINKSADLSSINPLFTKVKAAHENGGKTGSLGWQAPYSKEEASKLLLRTHGTVLSAHVLSKLKKDQIPAKFFSVTKVFRNEALDWSHLAEFHQVDGFVIDRNGNLATLLGYLKVFFKKMGYTDVMIRPAYFPYTEPSAEISVYNPRHKKWVELGGAGIFRPEVVIPLLGEDIPVMAWGLGMERIIVEEFGFTDLRDLYKNDIEQLQNIKQFMRM